jgi:hypothetical protein
LLSKNITIKIQRYIILPVVLYGCETWVSHIKGKHRFRLFKNSELRNTVGPKRGKVTRGRRKFHIEELHKFPHNCLSNQIKEMGRASGMHVEDKHIQGFGTKK